MKLLKKIPLVLFMACIVVLCAVNISSASVVESGKCGPQLTWTVYSDGSLVINGSGAMSWNEEYAPWAHYNENIKSVSLPSGVTSIGNSAFYGCINLPNITIPNSVTSIGNNAFFECDSLTSVTVPAGVTSIGDWAFGGCDKLAMLKILNRNAVFGDNVVVGSVNITLYGYPGSTTQAYAEQDYRRFAAIGEYSFLPGDINGNGSVNIADSIALFRYTMMPMIYPVSYPGSMDFTNNGVVDIADAIKLFRHSMMPGIYPLA